MDDAALLGAIGQLEGESYGFASGELGQKRAEALERYLGEPYGDEVVGRSSVVSTDLRDTVEWMMPQILRVFLAGDDVVKIDATGPEDEHSARLETYFVNHVILERNDAFNVFSTWFRDALIGKVGYVKAYWQTRSDIKLETYEGLRDDMYSILLADQSIQVVEHSEYPDPSAPPPPPMPAGPAMAQGMGPDAPPPPPMLHDVRVRRMHECGYVKVDNVPPEEMRVHKSHRTIGLQDCRFLQHVTQKTISELRQDGYEIPDDMMFGNDDDEGEAIEQARDRFEDGVDELGERTADPSTRTVTVRDSYLRIDYDGDGVAELRRVCHIGQSILVNEECDLVPFAAVTPVVFPHRHVGLGYDDLCEQPARVKTAMMRSFLDNLYLANNGRYVANVNVTNVDDLLVSRPGGVVRAEGDPRMAVMPLTHPVVGDTAMAGLQWVDAWRENATGVSAYYQGMNADALNKTATGITQIMSAAQGRVESVTRAFATGVKHLFEIVHALTLKHATAAEKFKLNNEWVAVDPREWVKRTSFTISVGLGTGSKEAKVAGLMQLAQMQSAGLQIGIATPQNLFNTGRRIAEEMGYRNTEEFWTDPSRQPPQPPKDDPIVQAEKVRAEATVKAKEMEMQGKQAEQQGQFALQAANDERALQFEREKAANDAALEQYKAQLSAAVELEKARIKAAADAQVEQQRIGAEGKTRETIARAAGVPVGQPEAVDRLEPILAQLSQTLASIPAAMAEVASASYAPKKVVRGKDGRAEAVVPVRGQ